MSQTMKPAITIVIPVYNRGDIVSATLSSIAAQTYRPFDVILIDNNSTDNTLHTLDAWKQSMTSSQAGKGIRITVTGCTRAGASAARNTGLSLVTTPWVMFFDSDDIMGPDHVAITVKDIENNPDADIIGWNIKILDKKGNKSRISRFHTDNVSWRNLFNGMLSTLHYCTRTCMMRQAGGWNEEVHYWIDIELGARLLSLSPHIIKSDTDDNNRVIVMRSDNSITGTPDTDPARMEPALRSIGLSTPGGCKNRILLKKIIEAAICSRAGSHKGKELLKNTLQECDGIYMKWLLCQAYFYTMWGGRGIALLYRILHLLR